MHQSWHQAVMGRNGLVLSDAGCLQGHLHLCLRQLWTMSHITVACRMPPNSQSNSDASMQEASDILRSEGSERSLASLANQSKAEAGAGAGASKAPIGQWLAVRLACGRPISL